MYSRVKLSTGPVSKHPRLTGRTPTAETRRNRQLAERTAELQEDLDIRARAETNVP